MSELKRVLFNAYNGFADKRITRLESGTVFLVDDRDPGVIGADRTPLSWFCPMHVTVTRAEELTVRLGNAPLNDKIVRWAEKNGAKLETSIKPILEFKVERGQQVLLIELATLMRAIVARGAPRYEFKHYKYSCPRVAGSLEKLKTILDEAWARGKRAAASQALFDLD